MYFHWMLEQIANNGFHICSLHNTVSFHNRNASCDFIICSRFPIYSVYEKRNGGCHFCTAISMWAFPPRPGRATLPSASPSGSWLGRRCPRPGQEESTCSCSSDRLSGVTTGRERSRAEGTPEADALSGGRGRAGGDKSSSPIPTGFVLPRGVPLERQPGEVAVPASLGN